MGGGGVGGYIMFQSVSCAYVLVFCLNTLRNYTTADIKSIWFAQLRV